MPNQFTTTKKTVGELLSLTSPSLVVPDWQRDFSWTSNEVDTFWQDLIGFSDRFPEQTIDGEEYFLGSVVLVQRTDSNLVLDGQQRLATSTILLSVIRDSLDRHNHDSSVRVHEQFIEVIDDATESHKYKLTLNHFDREFFRHEIQTAISTTYTRPSPDIASHRLIRKTREYFEKKINEIISNAAEGRVWYRHVLRIKKVLTDHMSLVVVSSTDEDNAASIFETLNDRGIGLSTPDLLRNYLLRRADSSTRAEIVELWKSLLENANETEVDTFLRHYWLSHHGDVKSRRLYREIKAAFEQTDMQALHFSRDLHDSSEIYAEIVGARDPAPEVQESLEAVRDLGAKSLYPAILATFQTIPPESPDRHILCRAFVTFFVRHRVIGGLENSQLESIAFKIATWLRQRKSVSEIIGELKENCPDDNRFMQLFTKASVSRTDTARYLLKRIEESKSPTQELEVAGSRRVHVEHIYPQNPAENRHPKHEQIINRLGNLTLLSARLNTQIKNSSFDVKKSSYAQSQIMITRELGEYERWTEAEIEDRQSKIASHAVEIWNFN